MCDTVANVRRFKFSKCFLPLICALEGRLSGDNLLLTGGCPFSVCLSSFFFVDGLVLFNLNKKV